MEASVFFSDTLAGMTSDSSMDEGLVTRAQAGDGEAREELARRYRRSAFLFALKLLGNREDALDVAQDAMVRFFTTLDRFDQQRPVNPWLLRIVRNRARDLLRRGKVRKAQSLDSVGDAPPLQVVDPSADPERDRERRELQRRIWDALAGLDPHHREILVLRDYQDLAYREIAQVLDIPMGTVMSRLHSARKRLRDRLGGRLQTQDDDSGRSG